MRYTFSQPTDRDLKAYGLSHGEALALLAKYPAGIMGVDLSPVAKRPRKAQANRRQNVGSAPAPIGPSVPQVMWLASCGKAAV